MIKKHAQPLLQRFAGVCKGAARYAEDKNFGTSSLAFEPTYYIQDVEVFAKLIVCILLPHETAKYKSKMFETFSQYYHELEGAREQMQIQYPDGSQVIIPDVTLAKRTR